MTRLHPRDYRTLTVEVPLVVLLAAGLVAAVVGPFASGLVTAIAAGAAAAAAARWCIAQHFQPDLDVDELADTMREAADRSARVAQRK